MAKSKEDLFYRGQFTQITENLKIRDRGRIDPLDIGALCMVGRIEDAKILLEKFKGLRRERVFCLFWIAIASIRVEKFKAAHAIISELFSFRHEKLSRDEQFYIWQLLGFYSFFKGKFKSAIRFSIRSWQKGFLSGKPFLQILSLDLRGQSHFQMGDHEQGILFLRRASSIANRIDNEGLAQTLKNTTLLLSSRQFLVEITELEKHIKEFSAEDSYSKNLIGLELVQRLIFEGQSQKAELILNELKVGIFAADNQRHINMWKERFGLLNKLKTAQSSAFNNVPIFFSQKIHDLVRTEFQDVEIKKEFLEKKLFTPFLSLFNSIKCGVIIDLIQDTSLVFDRGQITFEKGGLSSQLRGLLLLLLQGPQSSADIIHKLYGYSYDPLRHDPMVASLVHRLRKRFEIKNSWLVNQKGAFQIQPDIRFIFFEQKFSDRIEAQTLRKLQMIQEMRLNYRQAWALNLALKQGRVKPSDLVKEFNITSMTAFRDLRELVIQKHLVVSGKGRASSYHPKV